MVIKLLLTTSLFFSIFYCFSQSKEFESELISPVNRQMYLSGTFGELRNNHFHAGIDVKSEHGRSGDPLVSIENGYISRIMIHPSGFGNALMIDHPESGLTSVYAHLHRFDEGIDSLIDILQQQEQSYIIDFHLSPDVYPVDKGQVIGYMGNTGYSLGPHLHFEIRRTSTNWVLNPLLFGYTYVDTVSPEIHYIRLYGLDHERREVWSHKYNVNRSKNQHRLYSDTLEVPADRAAIAIHTIDKSDGLHHRNGIYRIELYVDDLLKFSYQMDSFPREDTRALNAHIDYQELRKRGRWMHRLHRLPGNKMPLYPYAKNDGLFVVSDVETSNIRIIVYDFNGNESQLEFYVKRNTEVIQYKYPDGAFETLKYDIENLITSGDSLSLLFPEGSLYDNVDFQYEILTDQDYSDLSHLVALNDNYLPIHKPLLLILKASNIRDSLKDKVFMGQVTKQSITAHIGQWADALYQSQIPTLGSYCLMLDTIPPQIKVTRFGQNASRYRDYRFMIKDNFESGLGNQGLSIEAHVGGIWVKANYDTRRQILILNTNDLPFGKHTLQIKARDHFMNERTWEGDYVK